MELEQKVQKEQALQDEQLKRGFSFQKIIRLLEKSTYSFNNLLHKISGVLLFLLMFLTVGDVIGRFVFNKPITGTYELTGLALAVIIFFSLGATQIAKGHIEIDFLTQKFPQKAQDILDTIVSLLLFILMILITWQLFEYTARTFRGHELTGDLGIALYIFIGLTIIGALAFTLTFLLDLFTSVLKVVKRIES